MINRLLLAPLFSWVLVVSSSFAAVADDTPPIANASDYSVNTFYALLVAEMAGQRQLYDVALGNYLLESHRTQDPGVTARATQIAQFIGADQAALDAATLWAKLDPSNPLAQQAISAELVKAARFGESALHLQKALDLDPLFSLNFIGAQGENMSEGSRESWLEALKPLVSQYKHNQTLLFNIASLYQQQEDFEQALAVCRTLLAQHPDFYPAWSLMSRVQATQKNFEGALDTINDALEQFKNDKSFMLLKARLLIKNKDIEQASATFLQLHKLNVNDVQVLLPLALTQLELKQYDEATVSLQKILNLRQMQSEAHYYLARIAQHKDNENAALNHYLAMKDGREYLTAQMAIINIYISQDNITKALKHVRRQRVIDNDNQHAYFLMEIDILNRTGQYGASFDVLNTVLRDDPNNIELLYARAMVAEELDNLTQLEKDLRHIIKLEPDNATALNALGYTLADRTVRLDEALQLIEQALLLSPQDPAILDSLGWVYFRLGKLPESLQLLEQAFALFPDAEVAAHLGEVLWVMNNTTQAKDVWRKALENAPDSQILKDTLLRLEVDL